MLHVTDRERDPVKIAVTVERAAAGWLAFAPEIRATAQDRPVRRRWRCCRSSDVPDLLADVRQAESRRVELVAL